MHKIISHPVQRSIRQYLHMTLYGIVISEVRADLIIMLDGSCVQKVY